MDAASRRPASATTSPYGTASAATQVTPRKTGSTTGNASMLVPSIAPNDPANATPPWPGAALVKALIRSG